jgi:hypothetical protein
MVQESGSLWGRFPATPGGGAGVRWCSTHIVPLFRLEEFVLLDFRECQRLTVLECVLHIVKIVSSVVVGLPGHPQTDHRVTMHLLHPGTEVIAEVIDELVCPNRLPFGVGLFRTVTESNPSKGACNIQTVS